MDALTTNKEARIFSRCKINQMMKYCWRTVQTTINLNKVYSSNAIHRSGGNHLERESIRMVEDNSGLGYKFQSSRRKGSSGKRVRREKVEKWKVLLKQGFCWIYERRWWVVIISGVSLVIVSVSILMMQKSQTPNNLFLGISLGSSLLAFSRFLLHR